MLVAGTESKTLKRTQIDIKIDIYQTLAIIRPVQTLKLPLLFKYSLLLLNKRNVLLVLNRLSL